MPQPPDHSELAERRHATAIAIGDAAALLIGPSGAGKSDLALRCLGGALPFTDGRPVRLVSDDQVLLERDGNRIIVSPPATIAGRLEVRGLGIVGVSHCDRAELKLIVTLGDAPPERLPEEADSTQDVLGLTIRRISLQPFHASAPAKLALAMRLVGNGQPWPNR